MQEKAKVSLAELNKEFNTSLPLSESSITVEALQKAVNILKEKQNLEKIEFVYGKGKRKTQLQRATKTMQEFLENKRNMIVTTKPSPVEIAFQKPIRMPPLCT